VSASTVHEYRLTVQIFDTDAYGVVWHGAYTKYLEMARCALMDAMGMQILPPDPNVLFPVVAQQFQFKVAARVGDRLTIRTRLAVQGLRFIFSQEVVGAVNGETSHLLAETTCIVVDGQWKPYRRIPAELLVKVAAWETSAAPLPV
jgi:acyl-CoA thioester hydrolase